MDTKGWKQFQAEFLKEAIQKIRFKKPVHELASILGIKENAMYKKIQLQTQLRLNFIEYRTPNILRSISR